MGAIYAVSPNIPNITLLIASPTGPIMPKLHKNKSAPTASVIISSTSLLINRSSFVRVRCELVLRPFPLFVDVLRLPEDDAFFLPEVDAILSPHNISLFNNQYIIAHNKCMVTLFLLLNNLFSPFPNTLLLSLC